jgi:formate C-acetyltransferase
MDLENIKTPQIIIRWFKGMKRELLDYAVYMNAQGRCTPSFFNEKQVIGALVSYGVAERDARTFAYYGCNNIVIPGLEDNLRETWHSGPKYLELALNAGADLATKKQIGPKTMAPEDMRDIEDVFAAYREQLAHALWSDRQEHSRCDQIWRAMKPFSYESLFGTDCIRKAASLDTDGSRYRHYTVEFMGIATVADSLCALDRLVFKEKRFTLKEFLAILADNWTGQEELAMQIRNHFPKYGNDDDEADFYAKSIGEMVTKEIDKLKPLYNGRRAYASFYSMMWHRPMGADVGATPDGRYAYTPFSENLSGTYGTEKNGPTGALNSAAKLPLNRTPSGCNNIKFRKTAVSGSENRARLRACIEGYLQKGGHQVMLTVADPEELILAKEKPEEHKNLMVRVFGFSDYFISLWPDQQDEIIARDTMVV